MDFRLRTVLRMRTRLLSQKSGRRLSLASVFLTVVLAGLAVGPAPAQALTNPGFCAWKNKDYTSTKWCYSGTFTCWSLSGSSAMNVWSSLKATNLKQWSDVDGWHRWQVVLYNHADCTDSLTTYGPNNHYYDKDMRLTTAGNINDDASAFRIRAL